MILIVWRVLENEYDEVADVNQDCTLNVLDIVTLVNWVLFPSE